MVELPWPIGPEQESGPQLEAAPPRRTPKMSLRWVPPEVRNAMPVKQRRRGRHRASEERSSSEQMAEAAIDPAKENKAVEIAWANEDAEYLYLIWLGPKGKMLDEQFPQWEFRDTARDRLIKIGEEKRVEAIERALQNPVRAVGRVSVNAALVKPALTEPIGEFPVVRQPNKP